MFLYHGLMLNGIIKSGQIPFLDIMYASFKDSRAIWEGPLPCRGQLVVQRFWTCHGLNLVNSKKKRLTKHERCMPPPGLWQVEQLTRQERF